MSSPYVTIFSPFYSPEPNWGEFVEEFSKEKNSFLKNIESKIVKIGFVLTVTGTILMAFVLSR